MAFAPGSSFLLSDVDVLQTVVYDLLLNFLRLTLPTYKKVAVIASSLFTLLEAPSPALVFFKAFGLGNLCPTMHAVLECVSSCLCCSLRHVSLCSHCLFCSCVLYQIAWIVLCTEP